MKSLMKSLKKVGGQKNGGGGQNRQVSKMLISLTFWCFFRRGEKSKILSRVANNEIIDRQGRKFLQRGIFDIFLHSPVLTTFLTFFDFFDKIQKLEGWVLYSNGQISVTHLFYFMTGRVKKFGGAIKDLYKKFMGEDLF